MGVRPVIIRLTACMAAAMMQGCFFTGVESTPRITGRDVRQATLPPSAEDGYLMMAVPDPVNRWTAGKAFRVTDERIARIFGAASPAAELRPGQTLRYTGATEAPGVTGETVTDLNFTGPAGERLSYRLNRPLNRVMTDSVTEVPFTIQMSMVDEAERLMKGRNYYVLTSYWRDDNDNPVNGRKYITVTIDSVSAGNALYPLKVSFHDGDGRSARIFMHGGGRNGSLRTFGRVFSFSDPRLKYPHITDEHWRMITNGQVTDGMTTEEVRLSLGRPKEVERGATNSQLREAWLYDNGMYLLFEDGLLRRRR